MCVGLLVALHFVYSSVSRNEVLKGAYFTTGSMITSNGEALDVLIRLQSHDNQIHDFEQINSDRQKFSFTMVNNFFGSARFLTSVTGGNELLRSLSVRDRDVAFNYAYLSSYASQLTFYKLDFNPKASCFYIKELERMLCLGADRGRDLPSP
ncbi:hypothetical protein C1X21_12315 [Pseudomonas sp. FW305-3-2-15-A-LB2]|nr:hypothetical protein C1X17_05700 [Pseudomonas sp. FW305-3-2-15-C-TSA2]PMV28936.1 hypothetical protein C1X22_12200 [Pseudomonas sp. DP16D-L5]PMV38931.1 hypothetical protein C1X21_12315 [Pseudomonas sp. FW305-3-2-15-A-LB2]PMV40966.1 hypothetical protein C1X16_24970 [Pseudomonas sp. FW305-3-2-15-C-R2A1]PMV50110.1 hypothetical protein C1X19_26855 [Pseudomonas sp. GW460-4]PMV51243.1 hypothetical protein C1X18_13165 [Pseudomonas sp. FW305-3-2-15-C-LB1]PMV63627.1 hypothetical protein C1X20_09855 